MREAAVRKPPALRLPVSTRGRRSAESQEAYDEQSRVLCAWIMEVRSRLDFAPSSRGWCYLLENEGVITKGEFSRAENFINDCRKDGRLPVGISGEDGSRATEGIVDTDGEAPAEYADWTLRNADALLDQYTPIDIWCNLDVYVEMVVEKGDLKSLFAPVCEEYGVPLTNQKGWSDINSRVSMMRRMKEREEQGKRCVLLTCGDLDPGGFHITHNLHEGLMDLRLAAGWNAEDLEIRRFGLDAHFVDENGLTWIDGLETSSGKRLDDPLHADHGKAYVQEYLALYGARKVEANALIVRPEEGQQLCREAIEAYVSKPDLDSHLTRLERARADARREMPAAAHRFADRLRRAKRRP